ncbi:MAG: hypothetical protein JOZ24_09320, partial [Candidatus Eremiobacteraeota bacterium]|nr:hypothetical protein [Candidatus Eremiobacteraeota bacterium]
RMRGGDILLAAIGITLLLTVGQYVSVLIGPVGNIVTALIAYGLVWTIPAAAVGGIPGGAAIEASIDRVRGAPLPAAIVTVVTIVLAFIGAPLVAQLVAQALLPATHGLVIVYELLAALIQSIAFGYAALVLTKTYTDAAFSSPRW